MLTILEKILIIACITPVLVACGTSFRLTEMSEATKITIGDPYTGSLNTRNGFAEITIKNVIYRGTFIFNEHGSSYGLSPNWRSARGVLRSTEQEFMNCQIRVRDDDFGRGECTDKNGMTYQVDIGHTFRM